MRVSTACAPWQVWPSAAVRENELAAADAEPNVTATSTDSPAESGRNAALRRAAGQRSECAQRRGRCYGLWCGNGSPVIADKLRDIGGWMAFRGDGIYRCSSYRRVTEWNNRDTEMRQCSFDGVNRQRRIAVSAIVRERLTIEVRNVERVAQPDMSGAIDHEPVTSPFHVVRKLRVASNRLTCSAGDVGVAGSVVPARMAPRSEDIVANRTELPGDHQAASYLPRRSEVEKASHTAPVLGVTEPTTIGVRLEQRGWQDTACLCAPDLLGARLESDEWNDCGSQGPGAADIELAEGQSASLVFESNSFCSPLSFTRHATRCAMAHRGTGMPSCLQGDHFDACLLSPITEAIAS